MVLEFDIALGGNRVCGVCSGSVVEVGVDSREAFAATETVDGDTGEDEESEVENP